MSALERGGPDIAAPPCPHFGLCGGCQLQNLSYAAQLEHKAAKLRELLSGFAPPELQLHASPPLGYRNRIRLTLREAAGGIRAGYLGDSEDPGTQDRDLKFIPITQCPIAAPLLWRAAEAFLTQAEKTDWLRMQQLAPDQLELFTVADESKLQLTLYLRTAQKSAPAKLTAQFAAFCESLRAEVPELAGGGIAFLPHAARSRRIEQARAGPAWGAPGLSYSVPLPYEQSKVGNASRTTPNEDVLTYWVPRGAFFQVNRFLLPELVALVRRVAHAVAANAPVTGERKGALAWDLYAGVGLFSRALARSFAEATAVEIAEPAATALAQTKLPGLRAVKAATIDFLRAQALQRDQPSLVVLDPPRAGLGPEACSLLARIAAPTLMYVSCSPQALVRDLTALTASGYTIAELHLFDLFPQTAHIETVAVLHR